MIMAEYVYKRAPYKCSVPNCNNTGKDVQIHRSPMRCRGRYKKWAKFAERSKPDGIFNICQCHFEKKCYSFLGPVPRLLPGSNPTLKNGLSVELVGKEGANNLNANSKIVTENVPEAVKSVPLEMTVQGAGDLNVEEEDCLSQNPKSQPQKPIPSNQVIDQDHLLNETQIALSDKAEWNSPQETCGDEYEDFGKLVACHLKQLPPDIALNCQKQIKNYLLSNCLNNLRNTVGLKLGGELLVPNLTSIPAADFSVS
ncbi:uncharacterized protein [Hetaerina americana]|uniref:uncharacterized protein n=1 Tax=Hetaerina americana TaxID=62018 RepID=UPI003A7F6234